MNTPNPGSPEAVDAGCTCPVLDNSHGRGYLGQEGIFVQMEGCPLHTFGPEPEKDPETFDDFEQMMSENVGLNE